MLNNIAQNLVTGGPLSSHITWVLYITRKILMSVVMTIRTWLLQWRYQTHIIRKSTPLGLRIQVAELSWWPPLRSPRHMWMNLGRNYQTNKLVVEIIMMVTPRPKCLSLRTNRSLCNDTLSMCDFDLLMSVQRWYIQPNDHISCERRGKWSLASFSPLLHRRERDREDCLLIPEWWLTSTLTICCFLCLDSSNDRCK